MKKVIFILLLLFISILLLNSHKLVCSVIEKRFYIDGNTNVEFISILKNCGATSSYNNKIYLIQSGRNLNFFNNPIIETSCNDLTMKWINTNKLLIRTRSAKIYNFTNFKYIDEEKYTIILESE